MICTPDTGSAVFLSVSVSVVRMNKYLKKIYPSKIGLSSRKTLIDSSWDQDDPLAIYPSPTQPVSSAVTLCYSCMVQ